MATRSRAAGARPVRATRSRTARPRRRVLMIASEARPFSKTGGLGDVLGALPPALARLGCDVTLVVPKYRGVEAGRLADSFPLSVGAVTRDVGFRHVELAERVRAVLVECPDLYDRDSIYGPGGIDYADSPLRFAMLVRAALEYAARDGDAPWLVHAHDWQAGLAPVYLKTLYASHPVLAGTPAVFTIHNLAYQGTYDASWLPRLDLGWELFSIDRLEYWGRISLLKGGIVDAGIVTTVSPRYAEEIQTPQFGFGFDGILRARARDLVGILNGIDTREWDPGADPHLPAHFDRADLSGKSDVKRALLARAGLLTADTVLARPLVGLVSRMVDQKGFDLLAQLEADLPRLNASFVVLGTGEAKYQDLWMRLAAAHPDRISATIGFDEGLAHLIEGGADIFLMPSQFEPCGLNQMYSLRYGTVPVVRAVGGLADTVVDGKTGFVFLESAPGALLEALARALAAYGNRRRWRSLQLAGMRQDYSWDRSAREYVKIYDRVVSNRSLNGERERADLH